MTDKNDKTTAVAQVTHANLITEAAGDLWIYDVKLFSMLDRFGGSLWCCIVSFATKEHKEHKNSFCDLCVLSRLFIRSDHSLYFPCWIVIVLDLYC